MKSSENSLDQLMPWGCMVGGSRLVAATTGLCDPGTYRIMQLIAKLLRKKIPPKWDNPYVTPTTPCGRLSPSYP